MIAKLVRNGIDYAASRGERLYEERPIFKPSMGRAFVWCCHVSVALIGRIVCLIEVCCKQNLPEPKASSAGTRRVDLLPQSAYYGAPRWLLRR